FSLDLPAGTYEIDADAPGFATLQRTGVVVTSVSVDLPLVLNISGVSEQVVVEAEASNSLAAQQAPLDARLDARSARTEVNERYIN
ncbi:hypothetical protein C1X18_30435, partial [Pseudomonas sp. FW305-3-2-15-C-LB1]